MSKKLGQHFLKNQSVVKKIITALDVREGETIIEIGPGHGELTTSLIEICEKVGAKIIAIEKDAELAKELGGKLAEGKFFTVISGDVLTTLTPTASNIVGPYKIVGNIPYYITGHLLRKISELPTKPKRAVIMIQKEVAERICAEPPKMNRLAASVQFWAKPKIIANLGSGDFSPPPKVDSAVIELIARSAQLRLQPENAEKYYAAVRTLFAQPRKTILNNLASAGGAKNDGKPKKDKATIIQALAKLGITSELRPQDLTIEDIQAIANTCA